MALEGGVTYIEDLVATNPVGATDNIDEGDDHIRNIKTAVKGSFPNLGAAAVTKTASQLNATGPAADKVDIAGDTMTGNLVINPPTGNAAIILYPSQASQVALLSLKDSSNIDRSRVLFDEPTEIAYFDLRDSSGTPITRVELKTDGNVGLSVGASAPISSGDLTRKDYVDNGTITFTNKTIASAAYTGTQTGFVGDVTGNVSGTALSVTGTSVVTDEHLAPDSVGTSELQSLAIEAQHIVLNTITANQIAAELSSYVV